MLPSPLAQTALAAPRRPATHPLLPAGCAAGCACLCSWHRRTWLVPRFTAGARCPCARATTKPRADSRTSSCLLEGGLAPPGERGGWHPHSRQEQGRTSTLARAATRVAATTPCCGPEAARSIVRHDQGPRKSEGGVRVERSSLGTGVLQAPQPGVSGQWPALHRQQQALYMLALRTCLS